MTCIICKVELVEEGIINSVVAISEEVICNKFISLSSCPSCGLVYKKGAIHNAEDMAKEVQK